MNSKRIVRSSIFLAIVGILAFVLLPPIFALRDGVSPKKITTDKYLFGTLETANDSIFSTLGLSYAEVAKKEHDAGIHAAQITLAWKDYEVSDGVFDENYMTTIIHNITIFQHAGQKVDVQLALHYVPAWIMRIPNAFYMNQYEAKAPQAYGYDDPNYVFNGTIRQKVQSFEVHTLQRMNALIGLNTIWDFRIDGGDGGEAYYGPSDDGQGHSNSYWAYDENAQGIRNNLPMGVSKTPFPGWRPGQKTYHNHPFSVSQVQQWYTWYFDSRMKYYNWQVALYRNAGFHSYLTVETPGFGTRPDEYTMNIHAYLNGSGDPNGTMSRAAVWQNFYPALTNKKNIIAYVSSIADANPYSTNDICQANDGRVAFNTDNAIYTWGGVRYVSYIANKYGFLKSGENPGYDAGAGSNYGLPMLNEAVKEMASCGLLGMFWAHDDRLYTTKNTPSANIITLADYAEVIHRYNVSTIASSSTFLFDRSSNVKMLAYSVAPSQERLFMYVLKNRFSTNRSLTDMQKKCDKQRKYESYIGKKHILYYLSYSSVLPDNEASL